MTEDGVGSRRELHREEMLPEQESRGKNRLQTSGKSDPGATGEANGNASEATRVFERLSRQDELCGIGFRPYRPSAKGPCVR